MGHESLQRVVVRCLYDEAFVEAVHGRPDKVLGAIGLDGDERAQLLAIDKRAWRTDPLRRRRTLRIIGEEYKVSTTLVFAETRSLAFVEGFFSSPNFHDAVMSRASITLAFGDFLQHVLRTGRLRTPQLEAVARLEHTMANCRRELGRAQPPRAPDSQDTQQRRPGPGGAGTPGRPAKVTRAPGVAVDAFEANVIETIHAVEHYLFEVGLMLQVALCDDAPRVGPLPPVSSERIFLLLAANEREVSMTYLEEPMFKVVREVSTPVPPAEVAARLAKEGLGATGVLGAIDALLEEGVLQPG